MSAYGSGRAMPRAGSLEVDHQAQPLPPSRGAGPPVAIRVLERGLDSDLGDRRGLVALAIQ
ncbi:hypothetical protein ACIHCV_31650 [Streptomyces sp. NPDC051956]|uniref:hypothetical protein n=1 Tax=Streptomyces sp. NPDC051956 TaxID=3365677 RepID=UPI0037D4A773